MSEIGHRGLFDRMAEWTAQATSRAPFFAGCVLLVVVWAPSYFVLRDLNLWQLVINTITTIVTFLLVALLQNSDARSNTALQHKLDSLAHGLSDLMDHVGHCLPCDDQNCDFAGDRERLAHAIGIEDEVGTKGD